MKKKKANKLIRRIKVSRKKIRKLNRKKILLWLNENLKGHPFILGLLFFIWLAYIMRMFVETTSVAAQAKQHLKLLGGISIAWLLMVLLSNAFRDKQKVKWYFRKRFVFFMLFLFFPLGLILLWSGSQFKKVTKIIFTLIFTGLFFFSSFHQEKKHQTMSNMSPFDRIIEIVTSKKKKVFLKTSGAIRLEGFKFARINRREKPKLAVSDIYAMYSSSIVSIKTKDKAGKGIGLGSGFIVSRDGLIVTNSHVVESSYRAEVKAGDRVFTEVYLVRNFPDIDMAILKIEARDLSPLVIGDSDELVSGQVIVALGNPLGFEQSVSSGIISSIRSKGNMKLIQMTAPISPGSSGGPLFNEYGEVIGITTVASFFWAQNLNFAIPINYLKKTIKQE